MPRAQVTHPDGFVMADGRVRIRAAATQIVVSGTTWTEFGPDTGFDVEMLAAPEPAWDEGDAARDTLGDLYLMAPSGRWRDALGRDHQPVRPMRRLIPEP